MTKPAIYEVPDENIEPEVLVRMTIPLLKVHAGDFEPHIREEDLEDENFDKRDRKVLLAMSIVTQQQEFIFYAARMNNYYARHMEAAAIRARDQMSAEVKKLEGKLKALEEKGKMDVSKVLKSALQHIITGGIGAIVALLAKH